MIVTLEATKTSRSDEETLLDEDNQPDAIQLHLDAERAAFLNLLRCKVSSLNVIQGHTPLHNAQIPSFLHSKSLLLIALR
jgi:hypothetical protein